MPERLVTVMSHPFINGLSTLMIAAVSTAIGVDTLNSLIDSGTINIGGLLGGTAAIFAGLSKLLPALGDFLVKRANAKVSVRCADPLLYAELQKDLHELNIKYLNERCFNEGCPKRMKIRMDKLEEN